MSSTKKRNVAVVGSSAPLHGERIPCGEDCEIWAASGLRMFLPRCDRWFEVKDRVECPTCKDGQRLRWLKKRKTLIYVLKPTPDMPESILYPREEVAKELQTYFTGPLSYMIALAIYENFDRISIHAAQLSSSQDHELKANVEYLLGIATGRGVEINLSSESTLLKASKLYGYDQIALYDHLWARIWRMSDQVYRLTRELDSLRERMELEGTSDGKGPNDKLRGRQRDLINQRAKIEGSMEECRFWMSWTNDTGFDEM